MTSGGGTARATGRLSREFFDRPVLAVARDLLGRELRHRAPQGTVAVRLTEVEAYSGQGLDPGSHAHRGRTRRNAVMFGAGGHLYVYFTYGMHWCANLVCGPTGEASGVLLRAGRVVEGIDLARSRRPAARSERELCRGPARLATSLGLDGSHNGLDVCANRAELVVLAGVAVPDESVGNGPRVGVAGEGADIPWRFWDANDPSVSVYRRAIPRSRPGARSGRLVPDHQAGAQPTSDPPANDEGNP